MAIKRKIEKIKIDNKFYYIVLDMNTIIEFKENTDLNFLQSLETLKGELDEYLLFEIFSYMLRKQPNSNPLGGRYFKNVNPMFFIKHIDKFADVINSSMPIEEKKNTNIKFREDTINNTDDMDTDWLYFISRDVIHMSEDEFLNSTPRKIYTMLKIYKNMNDKQNKKINGGKEEQVTCVPLAEDTEF